MKKLLILIVLSSISFHVLACKCEGPFSVESEYRDAEIVFLGKVLKVEQVGLGETMHPDSLLIARQLADTSTKAFLDYPIVLKATLFVKKKYKGALKSDTLIIYTGHRWASCGFNFKENKDYIVYGQDHSYLYGFLHIKRDRVKGFNKRNTYWTTHCLRTTENVQQEQQALTKYLGKE